MEGRATMNTSTTLADIVAAFGDCDQVDYLGDMAGVLVRKGALQVAILKSDETPGFFEATIHSHEVGPEGETPEEEAAACHAWKLGMVTNPVGAMLSRIAAGQLFPGAGGDGFMIV